MMIRNKCGEGFARSSARAGAAFEIIPSSGPKRLFVLSVHGWGGSAGPELVGARMPAFLTEPGAEWATDRNWPAQPQLGNIVSGTPPDSLCWARPISGQVVRDLAGRLCEARGREIRILNRVARDPRGQLLELLPGRPITASIAKPE